MENKQGYVYIITNEYNTVLYIGVTSNLPKRIYEHRVGAADGFSKKYNLYKLVYFEIYDLILTAIEREKFLKGKKRSYKNKIISKFNPTWQDLYDKIV